MPTGREWEDLLAALPDVRTAVDGCLPDGYECSVEGTTSLGSPVGLTVTVDRWPEGATVVSRSDLAAERELVLLGKPAPTSCRFPLSAGAKNLLKELYDAVVGVLRRQPGGESIACETMFCERGLRDERTKVLQSLKSTSARRYPVGPSR